MLRRLINIFEHSPVSRIKQFVRKEIRKFWLLLKSRFFNSAWHLNSAKNIWFGKPEKKTSELLDIFYFLWDWRAYHVFNYWYFSNCFSFVKWKNLTSTNLKQKKKLENLLILLLFQQTFVRRLLYELCVKCYLFIFRYKQCANIEWKIKSKQTIHLNSNFFSQKNIFTTFFYRKTVWNRYFLFVLISD